MFIEDTDYIPIRIYWKKKGHTYLAYCEDDFEKTYVRDNDNKKSFSALNVKLKEMTWGLYNDVHENSVVLDGNGERQFNYKLYKENRLAKTLVDWDAKDSRGIPVPVNSETLKKLAPPIAEAILKAYDKIAFLGGEQEKN